MARIAGIDIPREKRVEIALTYIYGSVSNQPEDPSFRRTSIRTRVFGPDRRAGQPPSRNHRPTTQGRRRPSPRGCSEHQAADRDWLVPRIGGIAAISRSGVSEPRPAQPADLRRRSASDARRRSKRSRTQAMAERKAGYQTGPAGSEKWCSGHVHVQASFNNNGSSRSLTRTGHVISWARRIGRFQGLTQEFAIRRRVSANRQRRKPMEQRHASVRGLRKGSGCRARAGDPISTGRRP